MPGFTVERDVTWFRYGDIPRRSDEKSPDNSTNRSTKRTQTKSTRMTSSTRYGPTVGVLTNYGSNEKGRRENYYPLKDRYLVQAFALKNLAIVSPAVFQTIRWRLPRGTAITATSLRSASCGT